MKVKLKFTIYTLLFVVIYSCSKDNEITPNSNNQINNNSGASCNNTSVWSQNNLGFQETMCCNGVSNTYTYNNFTGIPTPAMEGWRFLRNGAVVFTRIVEASATECAEVKDFHMVNDSTGFVLDCNKVRRTIDSGNDFNLFGDIGLPGEAAMYVVNKNTVYCFGQVPWGNDIMTIARFSTAGNKTIVPVHNYSNDTSMTYQDTLFGAPTCTNLSEINYRLFNGQDTVNYKIQFSYIDSLYVQ